MVRCYILHLSLFEMDMDCESDINEMDMHMNVNEMDVDMNVNQIL